MNEKHASNESFKKIKLYLSSKKFIPSCFLVTFFFFRSRHNLRVLALTLHYRAFSFSSERVQPVGLTSISYNWVILHIDMDQILVEIQIHLAGIGLNNKNFSKKYAKKCRNLKTVILPPTSNLFRASTRL